MSYQTFSIKRIAGSLGAEIAGVDLSQPLSNSQSEELYRAFLEHKVIFIRDQNLTPEQQIRAARMFGEPYQIPFVTPMPGYPEIIEIVREAEDAGKFNFGSGWHSDMSFERCPPKASSLYVMEVPPYGGDTCWVNMESAYEALSPGLKKLIAGRQVVHSGKRSYGSGGVYSAGANQTGGMKVGSSDAGNDEVSHPVVRTNPDTGRKSLFINEVYTIRFEDTDEQESRPLLRTLLDHARKPEFSCRFSWTAGTVAVWDNRSTMHYAIGDYEGHRRVARRVTLAGEQPQ